MFSRIGRLVCLCVAANGFATSVATAAEALDLGNKPRDASEISSVFRDMGVVQRKAMDKANHYLVSTYGSFDFSDGPYSMYGYHIDLGYALSDFWEVYLTTAPFFVSLRRPIVDTIESIDVLGGGKATILFDKPKYQIGAAVLWAPAYGKDSIGVHRVLRSDTFFKAGTMFQSYQGGTGLKFHLAIGKTYFINSWAGLRLTLSGNYIQTITNNVKSFRFLGIIEGGAVFYL